MIGTSLGPYKIIEQLGAGGMGEVYLGEDTRLGRKVAIKVLPAEFASDPERLARFEQEARAAAALNHPNIAVVHDIGFEEGSGAADAATDPDMDLSAAPMSGLHFMVQEYLDGETLRVPVERGALAPRKALTLATEIAEALAAAHAAGIVHRDLKPDNIFVTQQGHAKILDFGLAKLTEVGAPLDSSMSPTMLGTVAGQVMGTAGYMAPEQVRGDHQIDGRADLFALGCVLYEMVTGQRAFGGDNIHDVLNKLLTNRPRPAGELTEGVPGRLEWILEKLLAKDPADRYQTAADTVVDLRAVAASLETTGSGAVVAKGVGALPDAASKARSSGLRTGIAPATAALGAVVVLAVGVGFGRMFLGSPATTASPRVVRLEIGGIGTSVSSTYSRVIAIAPDGGSVALTVLDGLWIRRLESRGGEVLPGTFDAREPVFSPDSEQVAFWAAGRMKWTASDGSSPVSVGPAIIRPLGTAWGADGLIYVGQGRNGIWRVDPGGGEPEQVATVGPDQLAHGPELLPGGEWLVFSISEGMAGWNDAQIVAQSLLGEERVVLVEGGREPRYAAPDHLLFVRDGALFGAPLEVDLPAITGPAVPIESPIRTSSDDTTGAAYYDVADNGTLAYVAASGSGSVNLAWVDAQGVTENLPVPPKPFGNVRLSADQSRIAAEVWEPGVGKQIWIYDIDRPEGFRLSEAGFNRNPVWSQDGEMVYFAAAAGGNFDIWRRPVDLSRPSEPVYEAPGDQAPESVAPDGSWMVMSQLDPSDSDIWRISLVGEPDPEPLVATSADEVWPDLSPDGRHLAYAVHDSGEWTVYLSEIETKQRRVVATNSWFAVWPANGSRIFFNSGDGIAFVDVTDVDRFQWSPPQIFLSREAAEISFEVSGDGLRVLNATPVTSEVDPVVVVLNWFEELERLVPARR